MTDLDTFPWDVLDDERARTDREFCAASAEWLASFHVWHRFEVHNRRADLHKELVEIRDEAIRRVAEGDSEYIPTFHEASAGILMMRAKENTRLARAYYAVDDLTDDYRRTEFGCLVYRYKFGDWPRPDDLADLLLDEWDWQAARQALADTINEPSQEAAGIFIAPPDWIVTAMSSPVPLAGPAPPSPTIPKQLHPTAASIDITDHRCFVSAEAQRRHRLHEIYRTWAYQPFTEEAA